MCFLFDSTVFMETSHSWNPLSRYRLANWVSNETIYIDYIPFPCPKLLTGSSNAAFD